MKRREFLALSGTTLLLPSYLAAGETLSYRPGVVADLLKDGKTVFIDFYTDWCSTCRAQGRQIEALRKENPAYDAAMSFVKVNWDVYYASALAMDHDIPRRSTLLLLKGNKELGRIVAQTGRNKIKALLDKGLATS